MPLLERAMELGGEGLPRLPPGLPFISWGEFPFTPFPFREPDVGGVVRFPRWLKARLGEYVFSVVRYCDRPDHSLLATESGGDNGPC